MTAMICPVKSTGSRRNRDEIDNDCDDAIDDEDNGIVYDQTADKWFTDQDNDGYGDQTSGYRSCSGQQGSVRDNTDCNDADSTINPDTGMRLDGDGYGAAQYVQQSCIQPVGYVNSSTDCNDIDSNTYPGAE